MLATASLDCSANTRISSATTAKPLPASPALAASIEALRASRLVCAVIFRIESASTPIWSTTLASSRACSRFTLMSAIICLTFWRFSTVSSLVFTARLWMSWDSVAPSCALMAISLAASSICCVIPLICSAEAAVSSELAASSSVVADTSSISALRLYTLVSIVSTTLSILAASFFTWANRLRTDSRIVSSALASCPKSSLRLSIGCCIFVAKLPPAITSNCSFIFLNDLVISIAMRATSIATTISIHTLHKISEIALLEA